VLLGRIVAIAVSASSTHGRDRLPASEAHIEEVQLSCGLSRKRLSAPVILDNSVVERSIAQHILPGGLLYQPSEKSVWYLDDAQNTIQALSQLAGSPLPSILVLRKEFIPLLPVTSSFTLDHLGRDFAAAISAANETELVTRGPLELKSANVIPPQIVLDSEVPLFI
jgi:hypothetical protein